MGYAMHFPVNQLGGCKMLWGFRGYGFSEVLTLSLTSDGWGHSVTLNNLPKSSLDIFKFYILFNNHILDSFQVFF